MEVINSILIILFIYCTIWILFGFVRTLWKRRNEVNKSILDIVKCGCLLLWIYFVKLLPISQSDKNKLIGIGKKDLEGH